MSPKSYGGGVGVGVTYGVGVGKIYVTIGVLHGKAGAISQIVQISLCKPLFCHFVPGLSSILTQVTFLLIPPLKAGFEHNL
jgi:hypothetical protein